MPELGAKGYCKLCKEPIIYKGPYWEHVNSDPRHIAMPIEVSHPLATEAFKMQKLCKELGITWDHERQFTLSELVYVNGFLSQIKVLWINRPHYMVNFKIGEQP